MSSLQERLTEHLARKNSIQFCFDTDMEGYAGFEAINADEGSDDYEELVESCLDLGRDKAVRQLEGFDWVKS